MAPNFDAAQDIYVRASAYVGSQHLAAEVEWQRQASVDELTESEFLRQSAWVILCSGFKESAVRRVFDHISLCFFDWESAEAILQCRTTCVAAAYASFRNAAKLNAITECAARVSEQGFGRLKASILNDPLVVLQELPYIGPVTVLHLAKNLGFDVAKPDRHLVRLARYTGFSCVNDLCGFLAAANCERVNVVDLVLWRYLADKAIALA
jgi:hypothetical protein